MLSFIDGLCCGVYRSSHPRTPKAPGAQYRLPGSLSPTVPMNGQPLTGLQVTYDGTKTCQPDPDGAYRTSIIIKNPNPRGADPITFKIMINVHNVYVRPNRGLLVPGEPLTIQIRRDEDPEKRPERKIPKLMVKSTFVPPEVLQRYEHNLIEIWNRIERDGRTSYETWCIQLPTPALGSPRATTQFSSPSIRSTASAWTPSGNSPESESDEIARLRHENARLREHMASMQNSPHNNSAVTLSLYPIVSDIGAIGPRYHPLSPPEPAPPPRVVQPPRLDPSSLSDVDLDYFDAPVPSYEEATGRPAGIRRLPPI